ncbi:MAG: TlpA family protein disulfide reductase [Alphaproteobacteria bacterium]|nr:TlpA family protein disulfide reductase [Alphaproteobacteria bacterium]
MIADGPPSNLPPHIALEPALMSSRSLKLAVLGLCLVGPVLLVGCDRQSDKAAQPAQSPDAAAASVAADTASAMGIDRTHQGSALPDLTFADPSGKKLSLASLKGKPLLINLWATWCAPCVKELPTLEALAASGKVRVLTVSQDSGEPAKVAEFMNGRGLAHLQPWLDPDNDLAFHYNAGILPTTVLYDGAGREVWRFVGEQDWNGAESAKLLAEAR